ncbi:MAG: ABC transporter permease [Sedimentisphaerales bacterium]|nr:ABC transporter permease [Sedimentisphaerales bacterium]
MKLHNMYRILKLGAKSLWAHRLRSMLTTLGIVFGVCSVIAMLAIGEGASKFAQDQIARLGSHNIIITTVKPPESANASESQQGIVEYGLTYDDVQRLRDTIEDIDVLVPLRRINQNALYRNRRVPVEVVGTSPNYTDIVPMKTLQGRFISDQDMDYQQSVCVIDSGVYDALFVFDEPLGQFVRIASDYYRVVGVVAADAGITTNDAAEQGTAVEESDTTGGVAGSVYIPLSAARSRFGDTEFQGGSSGFSAEKVELQQITVKVLGVESRESLMERVVAVRDMIDAVLARWHEKKDYQIVVPLELLRQAQKTQAVFSIVLGSIASISLLVGGIGIMNIMLASVSERTREIGIRRALGARKRDIVVQFLTETVLLTTIGGILGIILGAIIPMLVSHFGNMPTVITYSSLVLSFAISAAVGVIFGLYPAYRAANMDPVEALRHE